MKKVDLNKFENIWYKPGNKLKIILWYFVNMTLFKTTLPISSKIKVKILKIFGTKVGSGIVIKPNVSIKYPWFLSIGNNCWIGEDVWIDNLTQVTLGNNVCCLLYTSPSPRD
jgi:putative colanic acid biosynthesis acetyltransferase WcaF